MRKKAVIFDLLGVITKEPRLATDIIYPMFKSKLSYDLFKKKYLLYCIGNISRKEFWEFICPPGRIEYYENAIMRKVEFTPGIKRTIKDIKSMVGVDLYLATEIPERWGELILKKCGLARIFRKKFYSSDLRVTKPFSAFYKIVFRGLNNSEIYYIDDTPVNLLSAQKARKHKAIHYNPGKNKTSGKVSHTIDDIESLKRLLA